LRKWVISHGMYRTDKIRVICIFLVMLTPFTVCFTRVVFVPLTTTFTVHITQINVFLQYVFVVSGSCYAVMLCRISVPVSETNASLLGTSSGTTSSCATSGGSFS
jgi:hypothetical protein